MPRSTWGSTRKISAGLYEIRYTVGGKRKSKRVRGSKREVDKELTRLRLLYEDIPHTNITIAEFFDQVFVPECENRIHDSGSDKLSPTTLHSYIKYFNSSIRPTFGDTLLNDLKSHDVQSWLNSMTRGKATHAKAVLKLVMRRAEDLDYIESHPMNKRYILPSTMAKNISHDIYTESELIEILNESEGEMWRPAFILAAFGGALKSEISGVKLHEIEFKDGFAVIPINRTVHRLNGAVIVKQGAKNEYREQSIVVAAPYGQRLEACIKHLKTEWLYDDGFGHPLDPDYFVRAYKNWLTRSNHSFVPFKNLRNSYSTMLHAKGVDAVTVSKLMRHSNMTTDYVHYNRPTSDILIETLKNSF